MAFIHSGQGAYLNTGDILIILPYEGQAAEKLRKQASIQKVFYSTTRGSAVHSLVICKSGYVIGTSVSAKMLANRCNMGEYQQLVEQVNRYRGSGIYDNDDMDDFFMEEEYKPEIDEVEDGGGA